MAVFAAIGLIPRVRFRRYLLVVVLSLAAAGRAVAAPADDLARRANEAFTQARFTDALALRQEELGQRRQAGDPAALAETLRWLARIHQQSGDLTAARAELEEALALSEQAGDRTAVARSLNNLGILHSRLGEYDRAITLLADALQRREALADPELSDTLASLAVAWQGKGDHRTALGFAQRALVLDRAGGDPRNLGFALGDVASLHAYLGEFIAALPFAEESLAVREQTGDRFGTVVALNSVGWIQRELGRIDAARTAHTRALALAEELKVPRLLKETHQQLAFTAKAAGDWPAAYAHQLAFKAAADAEVSESQRRQVAELSARYENERKDKELARLAAENARGKMAAARTVFQRNLALTVVLAALLLVALAHQAYRYKQRAAAAATHARDAAEVRAGEARLAMLRYQLNPHLLFNTLNSIRSLVLTDPGKARDLVSRLAAFARRALTPAEAPLVPLRDEWLALTDYLELEKARWEDLLMIDASLDPALAGVLVPPLLLQPLVENAIKFGQQTTTGDLLVRVASARADGSLVLTIANTGRWLEPAAVPDENSAHIGLANVRQRLAAFYGAQASVVTSAGNGWVTVQLTLPMS